MESVPRLIRLIIIQKPCGFSANGIPPSVFMLKIAANRVNGKTITEKTVKVLMTSLVWLSKSDSLVSCKASAISLWLSDSSQILLVCSISDK